MHTLIAGFVTVLVGFTGWFERSIQRIPMSIASGLLAGVLALLLMLAGRSHS